jgi:hypothetical protein
MGKTMYEVLFLEAPLGSGQIEQQHVGVQTQVFASTKRTITESVAQLENDAFRNILFGSGAGAKSRFHLSTNTRDFILFIIRAQCLAQRPISFEEAEGLVLEFMQARYV